VAPVAHGMAVPASEILDRKRQCSLGGRRTVGNSWVHRSQSNAFSELAIFNNCISRQGINVVEGYPSKKWRSNRTLPAGSERYFVNQTSVHCESCAKALARVLNPINDAAANEDAASSAGAVDAAADAGSSGGSGSSASADAAAAAQEQLLQNNLLLVSMAHKNGRLLAELKREKTRKMGRYGHATALQPPLSPPLVLI